MILIMQVIIFLSKLNYIYKMAMSMKKSINAKDILQYHQIQSPIQEQQPDNDHNSPQIKNQSTNDINHTFLQKIKKSQRKNRSRRVNLSINYQPPIYNSKQGQSITLQQNQQNQQNTKERQQTTATPFFQTSLNSIQRAGFHQKANIKRKLPFKIKHGGRSVKLTSVVRNLQLSKEQREQSPLRNKAKTITLHPQITKTKIFPLSTQKHKLQSIKNTNLNGYQLSIKRKNINILKMKLNSLAQKADMEQRKCCNQLDQIIKQNEVKKNMKQKFKKFQLIKNQVQYRDRDKFDKYLIHSTDFNRQTYIMDPQDYCNITSQTIQIRQISKNKAQNKNYVIHRKNLFDKSRYRKSIQDYPDQQTHNQSNYISLQQI